jgi:hypothetical protein
MELALRRAVAALLAEHAARPEFAALRDALRRTDAPTAPCWGDLADFVERRFVDDEAAVLLVESLMRASDPRPALLALDCFATRRGVIRRVGCAAHTAPVVVQRALVLLSLEQRDRALAPGARFAAAALELAGAPLERRAHELALHQATVGRLRAQRVCAVPFPSA